MIRSSLSITSFDLITSDDSSMLAYADLQNRYHRFILPEDPEISRETLARMNRYMPAFIRVKTWVVWEADRMVANASAHYDIENENDRTMWHSILVEPDYRRRGLGRDLLKEIYVYARENGRNVLQTQTLDRDLDGTGFLAHVGEKRGMEMRMNQLDLQLLDRGLLSNWLVRGSGQNPDFSLEFWENEIPEADLDQMAELVNEVQKTSPHDDLDIPEPSTTADTVSKMLKFHQDRGNLFIVATIRERATGIFIGYSEVNWHPEQATILNQWASLVRTEYRNHGLGRWLKAGMLQHVLTRLPEVRYVRTSNAHSNAPMLKINEELGFKHYLAQTFWQAELRDLEPYLEGQH